MPELTQEQIDSEVDRVLREALELFRTTHWTQRSYHRWDVSKNKDFYCPVGAISVLAKDPGQPSWRRTDPWDRVYHEALRRVAREIKPKTGNVEVTIIEWNDSHDRQLADVLAVFERATRVKPEPFWRRMLRRIRSLH